MQTQTYINGTNGYHPAITNGDKPMKAKASKSKAATTTLTITHPESAPQQDPHVAWYEEYKEVNEQCKKYLARMNELEKTHPVLGIEGYQYAIKGIERNREEIKVSNIDQLLEVLDSYIAQVSSMRGQGSFIKVGELYSLYDWKEEEIKSFLELKMHREKTRQESGYNDAYEGHGYCENRECDLIRQIMSTPTNTSEGLRIRAEMLWKEVEYLVKDYEKEEGTYEAECVQHLRGFMEGIAKQAA